MGHAVLAVVEAPVEVLAPVSQAASSVQASVTAPVKPPAQRRPHVKAPVEVAPVKPCVALADPLALCTSEKPCF